MKKCLILVVFLVIGFALGVDFLQKTHARAGAEPQCAVKLGSVCVPLSFDGGSGC